MIPKRAHHFNAWLDALVAGGAPNTGALDADTVSMRDAARKVQSAAQESLHRPDHRSLPSDWEDFMSAHNLTLEEPITTRTSATPAWKPAASPLRTPATSASMPPPHTSRSAWWTRGANAFLTLLLIAALGAGGWLAADRFNLGGFGHNEPPESIPFGGIVQGDGTPEAASIDPANLPSAEDCTIEPLTVDEVLWYITDTNIAAASVDMDNLVVPTEFVSATPPATNPPNFEPRAATDEELLALKETHHMYVSCIMADSYFQMWATMSPGAVQETILRQLPPLTGEDELRALLLKLEKDGPVNNEQAATIYENLFAPMSYQFDPEYLGYQGIPVLDTAPANSWLNAPSWLNVGYWVYDFDGTLLTPQALQIWDPVYTDITLAPDSNGFVEGFTSCTSYEFSFNDARDRWLLTRDISCEAILVNP